MAETKKNALRGKDLLSVRDLTARDIGEILSLAGKLKLSRGKCEQSLKGKTIALYFEKPSIRTRVSFEVGICEMGGRPIYIDSRTTHAERGESVPDMARVLSRYVHGIVFRAHRHQDAEEMAFHAEVPVINALTDLTHPCQALTDIFTIYEFKKKTKRLKLAYIGDGNNVAHSLLWACAKMGINFSLACPEGFGPDPHVLMAAREIARESGAEITLHAKPADAVEEADAVYTDVWVSMGQEESAIRRRKAFKGYCVTKKLMERAAPEAIFMHDLPAHRGEEVAPDVIDGERSVVFDQAENRLHVQKAILTLIFG